MTCNVICLNLKYQFSSESFFVLTIHVLPWRGQHLRDVYVPLYHQLGSGHTQSHVAALDY
jgi:hypothetical protein